MTRKPASYRRKAGAKERPDQPAKLRLMLLRHAKAERMQPGERDHDRLLAARGRNDAPKLGAYMVRHAVVPDQVIVSTSARTRETWKLVAATLTEDPPVVFDERIYEATPHTLLQVIKEIDPQIGTLLLIGHNPGLQELAALLIATGDLETRERLNEKFPTSGLAVIDFMLDAWSRLHPHAGRLAHFVTPGSLTAATD